MIGPARHRLAATTAALWACGALSGCQKREPEPAPVEVRPAASSTATSPAAPAASTAAQTEPSGQPASRGTDVGAGVVLTPATSCRAISVRGKVADPSGAAVRTGQVLDQPAWLTVEKGGEIAIKHAATTRELVFRGPAHFLPCDRGEERYLMTRGQVLTSTWAGARPGAEVLLATPFAVVRYGDAKLQVDVDGRGVAVKAAAGDAWLDSPDPSTAEVRIGQGTQGSKQGPALDVKAIVDLCATAADTAVARARAVLSRPVSTGASGAGAAVPLGVRAAEHVRARHAARSACAVAAASLENAEKGPAKDELTRTVLRAEARWRGVP